MDYRDHRAAFIFSDIARYRARLFDRLLAPHGLTTSQAWVLAELFVEDNLAQNEIARRMGVGTVTVGGLVERLEVRGLVSRHIDQEDRRIKRVVLKEAAKPIGRVLKGCGIEVNRVAFGGLREDEAQVLMDNLLTVRGQLLEALEGEKDLQSAADALLKKETETG